MSTGDGFDRGIDPDESLERVASEEQHGLVDRLVERITVLFR